MNMHKYPAGCATHPNATGYLEAVWVSIWPAQWLVASRLTNRVFSFSDKSTINWLIPKECTWCLDGFSGKSETQTWNRAHAIADTFSDGAITCPISLSFIILEMLKQLDWPNSSHSGLSYAHLSSTAWYLDHLLMIVRVLGFWSSPTELSDWSQRKTVPN